jgi:hypothetical protein
MTVIRRSSGCRFVWVTQWGRLCPQRRCGFEKMNVGQKAGSEARGHEDGVGIASVLGNGARIQRS